MSLPIFLVVKIRTGVLSKGHSHRRKLPRNVLQARTTAQQLARQRPLSSALAQDHQLDDVSVVADNKPPRTTILPIDSDLLCLCVRRADGKDRAFLGQVHRILPLAVEPHFLAQFRNDSDTILIAHNVTPQGPREPRKILLSLWGFFGGPRCR